MGPFADLKPPRDPLAIVVRLAGVLAFALLCLAFRNDVTEAWLRSILLALPITVVILAVIRSLRS